MALPPHAAVLLVTWRLGPLPRQRPKPGFKSKPGFGPIGDQFIRRIARRYYQLRQSRNHHHRSVRGLKLRFQ
jgi:hypothetical protein